MSRTRCMAVVHNLCISVENKSHGATYTIEIFPFVRSAEVCYLLSNSIFVVRFTCSFVHIYINNAIRPSCHDVVHSYTADRCAKCVATHIIISLLVCVSSLLADRHSLCYNLWRLSVSFIAISLSKCINALMSLL